jgi:hypothetical protein
MIDIQKMMQQAQDVQFKLQEMQEKLKDVNVEGESGGGLVKVTMSCAGIVKALHVEPSLIDPEDKETMEDLVIAALNNASENRDAKVQSETKAMMAQLGLPEEMASGGLGGLPV